MLPEWLEWVLALLVGFLVMEFVRYAINSQKYEEMLPNTPREGAQSPMGQSSEREAR